MAEAKTVHPINAWLVGVVGLVIGLLLGMMMSNFQGKMGQGAFVSKTAPAADSQTPPSGSIIGMQMPADSFVTDSQKSVYIDQTYFTYTEVQGSEGELRISSLQDDFEREGGFESWCGNNGGTYVNHPIGRWCHFAIGEDGLTDDIRVRENGGITTYGENEDEDRNY